MKSDREKLKIHEERLRRLQHHYRHIPDSRHDQCPKFVKCKIVGRARGTITMHYFSSLL